MRLEAFIFRRFFNPFLVRTLTTGHVDGFLPFVIRSGGTLDRFRRGVHLVIEDVKANSETGAAAYARVIINGQEVAWYSNDGGPFESREGVKGNVRHTS